MKNGLSILTSMLLAGSMALGQANKPAQSPKGPKPGDIQSPVVTPDGRVTFQLFSPRAARVDVIGDFPISQGYMATWKHVPMTKNDQGVWSVTTEPLKPDFYSYTFVIDGVRIADPGNLHMNREGRQEASWVIVPGPGSANYQINDVPHGVVSQVWYPSPTLKMSRRMVIYTPPGYQTGTKRYPVLYLLHNDRGSEDIWTVKGRAPQIFDNLLAQGKMVPMIVVMINANWWESLSSYDAPVPVSEGAPELERIPESLIHDVIPFVDKNYRTKPDQSNRAIAGIARGGAQTLHAALNKLYPFAWVGIFSGDIGLLPEVKTDIAPPADAATRRGPEVGHSIDPAQFAKLFPALDSNLNTHLRLLYLTLGTDDGLAESWGEAKKLFDEKGVKYVWVERPGYGSEWTFWRLALQDFTPRLFKTMNSLSDVTNKDTQKLLP